MSQVLLIIVITFGSLLNILAKPWSSSESLLERRRNDLVAMLLWFILFMITCRTVYSGITTANTQSDNAFDLQDWTALLLPFALAAPYLLELAATLVRQLEMWRWMRRASIQTLPIAWLYRTMTVGEYDSDGKWMRGRHWAPWETCSFRDANITSSSSSFWLSTTRNASIFFLYRRWLVVLLSALKYMQQRTFEKFKRRQMFKFFQTSIAFIATILVTIFLLLLFLLSGFEVGLLLLFDYMWWLNCKLNGIIVARYHTVHFGRQEMQSIFEHSAEIKESLRVHQELDIDIVHNRIMGAVITTAAVLENSFRNAYLVVPVYECSISNRKTLREKYSYVGCDLDRLIKQVRTMLEMRHTSGLLSITSSSGTIEASLHDNIESILSVSIFYKSATVYNITSRIAEIEHTIEERVSANRNLSAEAITRERVVYIDARNAMFWILWILVAKDWFDPLSVWKSIPSEKYEQADIESVVEEFPTSKIETLYVIATFLSRCRYCHRYGFDGEEGFYLEVRQLGQSHGKEIILKEFEELSIFLSETRSFSLLDWAAREYNISWNDNNVNNMKLRCTWNDSVGERVSAASEIVLL